MPTISWETRHRSLKARRFCPRRTRFSHLSFAALLFSTLGGLLGCGRTGGIDPKGSFTNASLQGSYAYSLAGTRVGQNGSALYEEAGTFVADGNGHITSGEDDFMQGTVTTLPVSGTYAIAADGTGIINLTVGNQQLEWAVTVASDSQAYIVEFDSFGCGGGGAKRQNTAAFSASPSGEFAFRIHNVTPQGSVAKVGHFSAGTDGSVTGDEDVLRGGNLIAPSITGTIGSPDNNGHGTLHVQESTGIVSNFNYYLIDANTLNLLQIDANSLGEGRVELRSVSSFDNSSMRNAFVNRSLGDTPASIGGANSVGTFTTDGKGGIFAGSLDSMQDGNPIANAQLLGTYSVASNGRTILNLNPQGFNPVQEIAWLVDASHGFFLINSSDRVEDGRFDQQQAGPLGDFPLSGPFGFFMSGYDNQSPPLVSRLGVMSFDGQQTVTFSDYYVNRSGQKLQKGGFTGTYSVGANGRFTASVPGVTKNLIGYLLAPNVGYLLVGDAGSEEPGRLEQIGP